MKVDQLFEAPLPEDWDKDIFNPNVSFRKRVEYAKQKAQQIGSGSSRVVFNIPYQGRETALKVAKNRKGMAQNEFEEEVLTDSLARGIVVPIIDADDNTPPTWIHTEKADKLKNSDIKSITGYDFETLIRAANKISGRERNVLGVDQETIEQIEDEIFNNQDFEWLAEYMKFIGTFSHVPVGDFQRINNWGLWRGQPVVVDVGLSDDILINHYRG